MAETAGNKRKDRALFGRLMESYQADRLSIFIDFDRLNTPRSPVFSPWENVAPLLIILLLAMAVMLLVDLLIGTLAMLLGVIGYLFLVRPWVSQRVYRRAIDAATDNLHNWNILWKLGGLVLTLNYNSKTRCVSPDGDWRAFVTRYLPEMDIEGTDTYAEFRGDPGEKSAKGVTRDDNIDM